MKYVTVYNMATRATRPFDAYMAFQMVLNTKDQRLLADIERAVGAERNEADEIRAWSPGG